MNEDTPQALPTATGGERQVTGQVPSAMAPASATGAPSAYPEPPPTGEIVILPSNHRQLRAAAKQIFRLLAPWKILFVHAATIVELAFEPLKKVYELKPISSLEFCSRIEVLGQLHKHVVVKDEVVLRRSICADATAKLLLATPEAKQLLSPISLVVECPIIVEEDGKEHVLSAGWHPNREGIVVIRGENPPIVNPKSSKETLLSPLDDFDFNSDDDLARTLACLLTPGLLWGGLLGEIDIPVFVIEADHCGAGKGYIFERIAAIYSETLTPLSPRKGGVGSFDEDFDSALLRGHPFVFLDNLRGRLDSNHIESFLTARRSFRVRTPHRAPVEIDPRKYIVFVTSNGFETTPDMESRVVRIRIRKRPANYEFRRFFGQPAFDHIVGNQPHFLGCVFAVIREWFKHGKPRTREVRHRCRDWAQPLDWIIRNIFKDEIKGRLMNDAEANAAGDSLRERLGVKAPSQPSGESTT